MKRKNTSQRLSDRPVLLEGGVSKVLGSMAIPQMGGVLGLILYNLVDTFYVGMLGAVPLAAISFTFPVVMVVGALAQGVAQGASALISRTIGEGDSTATRRLATHAMVLALLLVFLVAGVGIATIDPLFRLLGAGDDVLPYIRDYMEIWYPAVMFIIMTMVGNNILRSTGEVKLPGIIMLVAAGLNALLDPFFIFGLGPFPEMGVRGAALATALARSLTLSVALYLLIVRERLLQVGRGSLSRLWESWKGILHLGVPIMATRLIVPLGAGLVTRIVSQYGTGAVAGYGVAHRIESFALAFVNSLSVVLAPFVGQNSGAGRSDRVREAFAASAKFCFWVGGISFVVLLVVPELLVGVFNSDPQVVYTGALYLRIVSAAYAFQGLYMVIVAGLNVLRRPFTAAGLGIFQMFGLTVPLGLVFSYYFGLPGLFTAVAVSYLISGLASQWVLRIVLRDLPPVKEATSFSIPLILLHNGFDSAKTWAPVLPFLPPWIQPLAFDREGYGTRFDPNNHRDPEDIVEEGVLELDAFVKEKIAPDEKFLLWGHCVGGAIGLVWGARNPGRILGFVGEALGFDSDEKLAAKSTWLLSDLQDLPETYRRQFEAMHGEGYGDIIWSRICHHRGSYIMNPDYSIISEISGLDLPGYFLQGTKDVYFTPDYCRRGTEVLPRARVEIIEKGSHDLHLQDPEGITRRVVAFFAELLKEDLRQ